MEGTRRIQTHDLDFTLPTPSADELGQICATFENMRLELLKTNQELWRQAQERKRLNAAFAHDLRNPITVLKGSLKLLRNGMADEQTIDRLIGLLNIINTVYTNIHTRIAEIGMQRAIGMSAGSLFKVFLWEGAYYGLFAAVIGSVAGYICTIFVEAATTDTIQLVAVPVIPIAEATVLAIGACLAATCIPLRRISKMNIVESIEVVE